MDQQTLLILLTIFVAIAAGALVLQLVALVVLSVSVRKLQTQVMGIWPDLQAIIKISRRTAEKVEIHVNKIGTASTSILEVTRQQVVKIDELLNDAATRARVQLERAEMVLDDTMGRAQETVSIVQRTVLRPIRELHGVLTGLKTTLAYLSRNGRPTVDHATSDEEMFI